ncbi:hypothetical protein DQE84_15795, partial [Staphylococcus warneri]
WLLSFQPFALQRSGSMHGFKTKRNEFRPNTGQYNMIQQIDSALREDVRLLGNLLGETLKNHEDQNLFKLVEQIRTLSKATLDGQTDA